jgi:hypothetical protein
MIDHEITVARAYAECIVEEGDYQIKVGREIKMWGLTKKKAEEWAKYYRNAIVEKMK